MESPDATVARNVADLRSQRRHTVRSLSALLGQLGHPIVPSGITKIENGSRKVGPSDLVALAVALDVSPVRLLMPAEPADGVQLAPEVTAPWAEAWRWAIGEQPLRKAGEKAEDARPRVLRFIAESRPYEDSSAIREVERFLTTRTPTPYYAEIRHDGEHATARLTLGSAGGDHGER